MAKKPLTLGSIFLIGAALCNGVPTDDSPDLMLDWTDGPLPTNSINKRATASSPLSSSDRFVQNKLVEQSQALEYLVKLVQESQESLKQLAENLTKNFKEPKRPEKVETRRAGSVGAKPDQGKKHLWCQVALFCRKDKKVICGYDDVFGYGKFDDFCHMVEVNCYWDHNFALVPSCKIPQ